MHELVEVVVQCKCCSPSIRATILSFKYHLAYISFKVFLESECAASRPFDGLTGSVIDRTPLKAMSKARKPADKDALNKRRQLHSFSNGISLGHRRKFRKWFRVPGIAIVLIFLIGLQVLLAGSTMTFGAKNSKKGDLKVLILTAHPDDEVMFFAPAILNLLKHDMELYGLCLSNGNGDGLGRERANELIESYAVLGVQSKNVHLIDDVQLQDGMHVQWNPERIVHYVKNLSQQVGKFDLLLTFDRGGVSGHANHKACASTASLLYDSDILSEHGKIYTLKTYSLPLKFFSLPGALFHHTVARWYDHSQGQITFLSKPEEYLQSLKAMSKHKTQLVWFRYLYVLFSSYMYGGQFELFVNK